MKGSGSFSMMSSSHVSVSSAANMFAVASAENKTKKISLANFRKKINMHTAAA